MSHRLACALEKFKKFNQNSPRPFEGCGWPQPSSGTYSIFSNRKARCSCERSVGLNQSRKSLVWVHQSRSPRVSCWLWRPRLERWHHGLAPYASQFWAVQFLLKPKASFVRRALDTLTRHQSLVRPLATTIRLFVSFTVWADCCHGSLLFVPAPRRWDWEPRARECQFIARTIEPFPNSARVEGFAPPSTDWECVTYIFNMHHIQILPFVCMNPSPPSFILRLNPVFFDFLWTCPDTDMTV